MSIPDYQSIMLPLLKLVSNGSDWTFRNAVEELAKTFNLTAEERRELLPSGQQEIFDNRVGWARTYMKKAGLIDSPRRGMLKISQKGIEILKTNPSVINVKFLKQFPEFLDFQNLKREDLNTEDKEEQNHKTPEEQLEESYLRIRKSLAQDILKKVIELHPSTFEKLVVELLVKMGYGGSIKDAGQATKYTNDQGIDGIIKEDKLGLDIIYIQAKRWSNQIVGRPEIQSFVGALDGQRANKGIFITTSRFSDSALEYVKTITKKVILIDGTQLTEYMIDHNLGVSTSTNYEIKKIDNDYFDEE